MSLLAETSVNGNGVAETIVVFAITGAYVCVGNTPRPQDGVGEPLVCPRSDNGCTVFLDGSWESLFPSCLIYQLIGLTGGLSGSIWLMLFLQLEKPGFQILTCCAWIGFILL
jgi:hypothetical protein